MRAVREFARLTLAVLREIFDESAYQRFLFREGLADSRRSYEYFVRENETARQKRPRCC